MIKFIPILNKNANFYYFLHNLFKIKEPFHYRKWNISVWEKEIDFTEEKRGASRIFKRIYYKYFPKLFLGKYFFEKKQPWNFLRKKIFLKDVYALKRIFEIWEEEFKLIYNKDLPNLRRWKTKIQQENKEKNKIFKLINIKLSKFYNVKPCNGKVNVHLMLCGIKENASGERGRGLGKKNIIIELSRCSIDKMNYILGIIWHEFIHNYFEISFLHSFLLNLFKNQSKILFVEEIIARSLFPIGVLATKFFNIPPPKTLTFSKWESFPHIDPYQTVEIINLTTHYLEENKGIDGFYIKRIKKILKI